MQLAVGEAVVNTWVERPCLRMMQACHPHLKAGSARRVINFASLAGVTGPLPYGPCNMAKEAVRALTRTAAREWGADRITVNNVLPVADTWGAGPDMPPATNVLGRHGSPEDDIAPVALFHASRDAQILTGYSLTPDGGTIIDSALSIDSAMSLDRCADHDGGSLHSTR